MDTVPSLSDIKAVTSNNDGFMGGNGSWWIIILFLFIFAGWNGNGGWNGGGQTSTVYEGYVLNNDFSQLSRQLDNGFSEQRGQGIQLANGISSLGYEQLGQMNGINTNIMQGVNAIQSQLAQCCCDNKQAIAGVNYNMATNTNAITNAVNTGFCQTNFNASNNTRDIIDSQNAGTQAILQAINKMNIDAKDSRIAELTSQVNALQLSASQQAQNNYLLSELKACPKPAYVVANPYCSCGQTYGCNGVA